MEVIIHALRQQIKEIAVEVSSLLENNPVARSQFTKQLKEFSNQWKKYQEALYGELIPLFDEPGENIKDLYEEYDGDFQCWLPKGESALPPNRTDPSHWKQFGERLADKLPSHYATVAVIYDSIMGEYTSRLCKGILDDYDFGFMWHLIAKGIGFNEITLQAAIEGVKRDLAEKQGQDGQDKWNNVDRNIITTDNADKNFLLSIAKKVDILVAQPVNMSRFREIVQMFFNELQKAESQLKAKLDSKKKSQSENMDVPYYDVLLNLLSLPSNLAAEELAEYASGPEENIITQESKLRADYTKLAIIHDKRLKGPTTPKINDNIWPQKDSRIDDIWDEYKNKGTYGEGKSDIESTFERVKANLLKLQTNIDQGEKKKQGRPHKHSVDVLKAASKLFDELQEEGKSVNECWFEVHNKLNFDSPNAAKQAVYRFKKQNKKQK